MRLLASLGACVHDRPSALSVYLLCARLRSGACALARALLACLPVRASERSPARRPAHWLAASASLILSGPEEKKAKERHRLFATANPEPRKKREGVFFNPNMGTTNGAPTVVLHSLSPFLGPENDPVFEHGSGHRFRNQVVVGDFKFPCARAWNSCTMCARLCSLSSPTAS